MIKSLIFLVTVSGLLLGADEGEMFTMEDINECMVAQRPELERPDLSFGRYEDLPWMTVQTWCEKVTRNRNAKGRDQAKVIFFGDSITEGWGDQAPRVWQEYFGDLAPLQLGIGGDQTQQLLWRIENGELDGTNAELLVLLIGVNNIGYGGWAERETAEGVQAVLRSLKARWPQMAIINIAILPAMSDPSDSFRTKISKTNEYIRASSVAGVKYVDIGYKLLEEDGSIGLRTTYDYLHPNAEGYRLLGEALRPIILEELAKR